MVCPLGWSSKELGKADVLIHPFGRGGTPCAARYRGVESFIGCEELQGQRDTWSIEDLEPHCDQVGQGRN